jgi:hypothetical protein
LYPLQSQLGQACMCTTYLPLTVRKHSACSTDTSFSNNDTVVGGGTLGSPEKHNFTMSLKILVSPVAEILSDEFKSDIISYLNFRYNGLVFFNIPL